MRINKININKKVIFLKFLKIYRISLKVYIKNKM